MNKAPSNCEKVRARLRAMNEANTVVSAEFHDGDYFVSLVPTWQAGHLYYRFVEFTPFHERAGLGVMSNTYMSASWGLKAIFDCARSSLRNQRVLRAA